MCGICGIAYADVRRQVASDRIRAMCDDLAHRGPDDAGVLLAGHVALGHRRLSIIDVVGGHQPMANESDDIWLAFNGEVYNHADLRAGLKARGHQYRTRTDSETIVHLYEERGSDVAEALRGIFAFAVWDSRRRTLLLVRDRSGVKPLYYTVTAAGDLAFASEIRTLFASGLVNAEIAEDAVPEYFAWGHVSGTATLLRGVRKLQPGELLEWCDGHTVVRPYWSLRQSSAEDIGPVPTTIDEAGGEFWRRFVDGTTRQLMSDVPLGVFLSGGLDSSLLVAAMHGRISGPTRTFSVGYEERSHSELPHARTVARAFGTEHFETVLGADSFFNDLPDLTRHLGHPMTFSASIPLYHVARLAAGSVKVVLTGEGSDELFAGYGRYWRALLNRRLARMLDRSLPRRLRTAISGAVGKLGEGYLSSRMKRSFLARDGSFAECYLEAFADFRVEHRRALLGAFGDPLTHVERLLDPALGEWNPLEALLRFDQRTYLDELLMKQDHMSMAASIESRVPFLDESLVEWAARLPASVKLSGRTGKALLRHAAARHVPAEVLRGPKRGFSVPLSGWLRQEGRGWLAEFAPHSSGDLLSASYIQQLIDEHVRGIDHTARLWRIIAFQVWRREVVDNARRAPMAPRSRGTEVCAESPSC